jgi:hypothetical protein
MHGSMQAGSDGKGDKQAQISTAVSGFAAGAKTNGSTKGAGAPTKISTASTSGGDTNCGRNQQA